MKMNQDNNTKNLYRTSDLSLCAALCVSGFVAKEIEKVNPQRSAFVFDSSVALEEVVAQYWQGELRVEPQVYFNQLRTLKSRIYQR